MDHVPSRPNKLLPANAYTKLKPGESYEPIVGAADPRPEISRWSIGLGLFMVFFWAIACIFIALKTSNGIEAAIPIAVMAIFFGKMRKRKSTILENVMVQSIGQAAGVVAAGAAFVVPAFYFAQLDVKWWHIFAACAIGGGLGIVLIIPLRKYFVADLHGELPFPEATATNEILVSGEKSGKAAGGILISAIGLGALYDFLAETVHAWNPVLSMGRLLQGTSMGTKLSSLRYEIKVNGFATTFGLGYIIGIKYAAIIAAGSVLAWLVMVPFAHLIGSQVPEFTFAGKAYQIASMGPEQIFASFVKPIGIGAIAISAIIGMLRMGKIIAGSVSLGFKGLAKKASATGVARTGRDLDPKLVILVQLGMVLAMALLFFVVSRMSGAYGMGHCLVFAAVGALAGFILSFLFTPVAAQAIAIVGTNPVSGMTLITILIAAVIMMSIGLAGKPGMFIALVIGTAVCTALSTAGGLVTDFKIGYWIGSTPRNQQVWKFAGILIAALTVSMVIPLMDRAYGFMTTTEKGEVVPNTDAFPASQATMLKAITEQFFLRSESKGPDESLTYLAQRENLDATLKRFPTVTREELGALLMASPEQMGTLLKAHPEGKDALLYAARNEPMTGTLQQYPQKRVEDFRGMIWEKLSSQQEVMLLYALGGMIAILLYLAGVPMLAFSLGIFIPIGTNLGVLAGGFCAWLVGQTGKTEEIKQARQGQGTLIASGLIAGAAIMGIVGALVTLPELGQPIRFLSVGITYVFGSKEGVESAFYSGFGGQLVGLIALLSLGIACYLLARKGAKAELAEAAESEGGDEKAA